MTLIILNIYHNDPNQIIQLSPYRHEHQTIISITIIVIIILISKDHQTENEENVTTDLATVLAGSVF